MFLDKIDDGFWACKHTWSKSANNTKWCLIGCATGEFATLAYYSFSGITSDLVLYSTVWYLFAALPLKNGTWDVFYFNADDGGRNGVYRLGIYRRRFRFKLLCNSFDASRRFFSPLAL